MPSEKIPPLPKVAPAWSWHYFRMRYLAKVASGLTLITAVWLWTLNLPENGTGAGSNAALPVDLSVSTEHQAGALLSTNLPDLHTGVTNGNLGLGGGL
ncbi:MAG TPA: hypothetical protein VFZ59_20835 [Verrucomicrobiae bacterium]|nr:hypothetical protein [Verrucomicrobiae bacterium]